MLYHGTSLDRAWKMASDQVIRVAPCGVKAVSMTDDPKVAIYFAALAADADRSTPVVLPIDADKLIADGYVLEAFADDVWGEGECDWERETVCWQDIPFSYTKVDVPRCSVSPTVPPKPTDPQPVPTPSRAAP